MHAGAQFHAADGAEILHPHPRLQGGGGFECGGDGWEHGIAAISGGLEHRTASGTHHLPQQFIMPGQSGAHIARERRPAPRGTLDIGEQKRVMGLGPRVEQNQIVHLVSDASASAKPKRR